MRLLGVRLEMVPPGNEAFARSWLLRQMDFVEQYRPDLVYLDDYRLPFGQYGLDAVAHYYDRASEWHGTPQVVITAKRLGDYQRDAILEDVERGFVEGIRAEPWQTSTCLGNWHYDRPLYERHGYKSAKEVVQRLADVVAKNGNLLLSVPQRGDGSIDADEDAILAALAGWMDANGAAIHGTRPWRVFGEGPTRPDRAHGRRRGEALYRTGRPLHDKGRGAPRDLSRLARRRADRIAPPWKRTGRAGGNLRRPAA